MKKLMVFCGILFFPLFASASDAGIRSSFNDVPVLTPRTVSSVTAPSTSASTSDNIFNKDTVTLQQVHKLDSIVVQSNRAGFNTPVTYSQISRKELQKESSSHSLPMLLQLQPSVVATTEGGLGLGYTKMSIRGTDDSRTNITINGISMNDSESQQVFWVNLPSIHSFLSSAQLQRGVGTSANGSGAFGASLNLQTNLSGRKPYGSADFTVGSYQTYMTTIAAGSGLLPGGFSFDVVYSRGETQGYIRNAKADLNSVFATASWVNGKNSLKLRYIFGDQETGITWEGISLEQYEKDRRYNPAGEWYDEQDNVHYYDNETDNYQQHYVQAAYTRSLGDFFNWNTTLNFTKGDGYYENYKADTKFSKYGMEGQAGSLKRSDFIVQQAMDNSFYALNTSLLFRKGIVNASAAVSYSFYDGEHFGDVLWCKHLPLNEDFRWYNNFGRKEDFSGFVRAEVDFAHNFTGFADLQYRGVSYELEGLDKDFVALDWDQKYNFFNPKMGLSYAPGDNSRIYASVAVAHREPSRSDIKESIKSASADRLKAEQLVDFEVGYRFASEKVTLSANLYFMEYKNQLVATGKLSDVGYVIKENIPDSYRRGIELAGAWQALPWIKLDANLTLSRNKAIDYTAYIDTYDNSVDWNPVAQTESFFDKTSLILSPEVVGMAMATFTPGAGFDFSLSGKYVGEQFMDNYNSDVSCVPAYFVSSLNLSKCFRLNGVSGFGDYRGSGNTLNIGITIDNLFNNKYYSYGWIYQAWFADGSSPYVEQGIYPQAPLNFMVKVSYKF